MKITGPSGPTLPSARRPSAAGGAFQPTGPGAAGATAAGARPGAATGVTSLDALLALQEVGGPLERRRRAVARAGKILDSLDGVRLALLGGGGADRALAELTAAVRDSRSGTEDPTLEGVLDEIETRAAVELAKSEMARAA
jgi:hypothetical protein